MVNEWKNESTLEGDEGDVWFCPFCEWAMELEDNPADHGYNFCPHCGRRMIYEKE